MARRAIKNFLKATLEGPKGPKKIFEGHFEGPAWPEKFLKATIEGPKGPKKIFEGHFEGPSLAEKFLEGHFWTRRPLKKLL